MINCVIIDDEPLARECLRNYIREVDFLALVGVGSTPMELVQLLDEQPVDLIFLDIQMPGMNGIDYIKSNSNIPPVILTTAYPSYAIEGFELSVLDYLLKPITFNRFFKSAIKAKDYILLKQGGSSTANRVEQKPSDGYFFIKCNNKFEKIFFSEILFVQSMQNYVMIYTEKDKYMTLMNLKSVEQNLSGDHFLKVHKSYIISVDKVSSIEGGELMIAGHQIPISRNLKKEIMEQVMGDNLWKNEGKE